MSEQSAEIDYIRQGDCLTLMASMPDASIDAIVTDPPYGLGFMGKAWDALPPGEEWARQCLRVLKPGGHLLAFGGSRTWHRLAVAIEDAEFELRDSIAWMYGSGFPKSMDVSKAIDKAAGAERIRVADSPYASKRTSGDFGVLNDDGWTPSDQGVTTPATPDAEQWQGWGTALKPAFEPIVVARKPFDGPVAANVLEHGTGALNIDACRIGDGSESRARIGEGTQETRYTDEGATNFAALPGVRGGAPNGRWPANVVLDESQAAALDEQTGVLKSGKMRPTHTTAGRSIYGQDAAGGFTTMETYGDSGGASRFFYVAKAPKRERPVVNGIAHPTVKPLALMRWLVRLVTPPGGTVLDPFAGSGTTLEAVLLEGFTPLGFELAEEYIPLVRERLARAAKTQADLFGGVA